MWEQLLGRMHRPGQEASVVYASILCLGEHHEKILKEAKKQAQFIEQMKGLPQRFLYADWVNLL